MRTGWAGLRCSRESAIWAARYCVPPTQFGSRLTSTWCAITPSSETVYGPEYARYPLAAAAGSSSSTKDRSAARNRGRSGRMICGHVAVGGVHDDSFGVGAQRIARVRAIEGKALVRLQYPSSDDVVAQVSCGERGHIRLMSFPCKWCSYGFATARCAMSARAVIAVSNGSGLRSTRLTMSAPSMLVTVLSASALADSWGTAFSSRRAVKVAMRSRKARWVTALSDAEVGVDSMTMGATAHPSR